MKMEPNSSTYSSQRITSLVLKGTILAVLLLGSLLVLYNGVFHSVWLEGRTWLVVTIFLYLFSINIFLRKNYLRLVNYMLIVFYIALAFITLLLCGLNTPVGILTISFAVVLSTILTGTKSILPVAICAIVSLIVVQTLHNTRFISPKLDKLSLESTYWDVAAYSTIITVFALVSWFAGSQREKNLTRALAAESALRLQKELLVQELEKESAALRNAQLNQIRHLHKFALLGQSTAATLHDLSNHLSVLNLDINDISQQVNNTKVIDSAKDSIKHINKMVRQARQQLNSYDDHERFNVIAIVNRSVKDVNGKFAHHTVKLTRRSIPLSRSVYIRGNPLALMQVITILLNNALDATKEVEKTHVIIETKNTRLKVFISVIDNGPGINQELLDTLFNPVVSTKPTGLGVGLYIAHHLIKEQFNGSIKLLPTDSGAHFQLSIPKK